MNTVPLLVLILCASVSTVFAEDYTGSAPMFPWTTACEAAPWPDIPNQAFRNGEKLRYAIHWGFLSAGIGSIDVKPAADIEGRSVHHLTMEFRTTGAVASLHRMSEHTDTWIDQGSLLTVRLSRQVRESKFVGNYDTVLDQSCRRYEQRLYRADKDHTDERQGQLSGPAVDVLGYIFRMRAEPMDVGQRYSLNLVMGNHIVPLVVEVRRKETLKAASGKIKCFYIAPVPAESQKTKIRSLDLWLSADARRVPVRFRIDLPLGDITADLVSDSNPG